MFGNNVKQTFFDEYADSVKKALDIDDANIKKLISENESMQKKIVELEGKVIQLQDMELKLQGIIGNHQRVLEAQDERFTRTSQQLMNLAKIQAQHKHLIEFLMENVKVAPAKKKELNRLLGLTGIQKKQEGVMIHA